MTMLVGVAAVLGMNCQGLAPSAIIESIQHGMTIRVFVAAAEWLTAIAAGYAAARIGALSAPDYPCFIAAMPARSF